jgi:hypothetical protein
VGDSGFSRIPDRLFKLCGSHVQQSEALRAMIGAYGPYNLGGSATAGIRAHTLDLLQHYL